jgi:hypothetical protein
MLLVDAHHINRAALAEARKSHFRNHSPVTVCEFRGDDRAETCVRLIDKSINVAAAPADLHVDPRVERQEQPTQRLERQRVDVAAFGARDDRLRDAAGFRHVRLAPSPASAERAQN